MQIEFQLVEADLLALSLYHAQHSPATLRRVRRVRLLIGILLAFLAVVYGLLFSSVLAAVAIVVLDLLFVFFWPRVWLRSYRRVTLESYRQGQNRALLSPHTLELLEDGLLQRSEWTETKLRWPAVERLESTPDHTFVYTTSVSAIIIPRQNVRRGDYGAFVAELRARLAAASS